MMIDKRLGDASSCPRVAVEPPITIISNKGERSKDSSDMWPWQFLPNMLDEPCKCCGHRALHDCRIGQSVIGVRENLQAFGRG